MPNNIAVIGMQFGDEGKGKIVDFLAQKADVVARFNGGNNAGHTITIGSNKIVLHHIPSGIMHKGKLNVMGNGMVINPKVLIKKEFSDIGKSGIKATRGNLAISGNAHIILPHHIEEDKKTSGKIGTTLRGIGPVYADKARRTGLRFHEFANKKIFKENFFEKNFYKEYSKYAERLSEFLADTSIIMNKALDENKRVLFEGAQGTMLDIDHGTYPYVSSSNATVGGVCTGLGIGPKKIESVMGVIKAYATRVGGGPFPVELKGSLGDELRQAGKEFGSTTGRPRRIGWFDAVTGKYSARINDLDSVAITKLDVLDRLEKLKICTAYEHNGRKLGEFTTYLDVLESAGPVYEEIDGWQENTTKARKYDELPENAKKYIKRIEELIGVPVSMVSVGPEREQTIVVKDDFLFR